MNGFGRNLIHRYGLLCSFAKLHFYKLFTKYLVYRSSISIPITALVIAAVFFGCSPAKYVPEGQYLLSRVSIKTDNRKVDNDELYALVKQKPNRRILGILRFHLWIHNRARRGKEGKFWNTIGEAPVVFDSTLTKSTEHQISLSLKNGGYYDNNVTTHLKQRKKKIKVTYQVESGLPYRIRKLGYMVSDPFLDRYLESDSSNTILKVSAIFDMATLEKERARVTNLLKNYGYYYFSRNHVFFEADTTLGTRQVDLFMGIHNAQNEASDIPDSLREEAHKKYRIRDIYVNIDYTTPGTSPQEMDTVVYNGIYFVQAGKFKFKPKALERAIFVNRGEYYLLKDQDLTYRRLQALRNFKYVNITFESAEDEEGNRLDCYIRLVPVTSKSVSLEMNLTHSGGNNGVEGNIGYQNLNTFRGAEVLNVNLNGGLEVQQLSIQDNDKQVINQFPFNTIELGPEISLHFPRFLLPFKSEKFSKNNQPKTTLSTGFNFQQRPDYNRTLTSFSLSYSWYESRTKQHVIQPMDISFIRLNKSDDFERNLQSTRNSLLINSYTDHFIMATKYSFILNTQSLSKTKNFMFFRGNLEVAGNLLNAYNNAANNTADSNGSYHAFGVRYAQYVRTDLEYKYYILKARSSLVFRALSGIGRPYGNLDVLPFEKSFFAGGSNDIRAWKARDLGPGSIPKDSTEQDRIDQIGDFKMEANLEYRFDISKIFEGAVFTDIGNIWLVEQDDKRPNAELYLPRLWRDLAIGVGVGLRLDFTFFLIRFDLATRAKDPESTRPEEVKVNLKKPVLNFGIGYPF
jgi:outer membrane protein assembly factor BamA